jgi:hypothetical protein
LKSLIGSEIRGKTTAAYFVVGHGRTMAKELHGGRIIAWHDPGRRRLAGVVKDGLYLIFSLGWI